VCKQLAHGCYPMEYANVTLSFYSVPKDVYMLHLYFSSFSLHLLCFQVCEVIVMLYGLDK